MNNMERNNVDNEVSEVLMASIKDSKVEKKIQTAKEVELDNWKNFNVYKEVKNERRKAISVRWVVTEMGGNRKGCSWLRRKKGEGKACC